MDYFDPPEPRFCFLCGKIATRRCEVCSTIFCNDECERRSWIKHREFCRELAEAIKVRNGVLKALLSEREDVGAEIPERRKRSHSPTHPRRGDKRHKTGTVQKIMERHGILNNANAVVPFELPPNFEFVAPMALSRASRGWRVQEFVHEYIYPILAILYATTRGTANRALAWKEKKQAFLKSVHFAGTVEYFIRPTEAESEYEFENDDEEEDYYDGERALRLATAMRLESALVVFHRCPCEHDQRLALLKFVESGARTFKFYGESEEVHGIRTLPYIVNPEMTKIVFCDREWCQHVLKSFESIRKITFKNSRFYKQRERYADEEVVGVRNACVQHKVASLSWNFEFGDATFLLADVVANRDAWTKFLSKITMRMKEGINSDIDVPSGFVRVPIERLTISASTTTKLEYFEHQCLRVLQPRIIQKKVLFVV
jgi:hypothetical protein